MQVAGLLVGRLFCQMQIVPNPPFNMDAPHIAHRARIERVTKRASVTDRAAARQLTLRYLIASTPALATTPS